jgi:membrane-bound lytic murein transglycosylase C
MRSSTLLYTLLMVTFALATSACETTDRALTAAERVVRSRAGQTVIDLAEGKDPAQIAKKRLDQYARDPEALLRDLRAAK